MDDPKYPENDAELWTQFKQGKQEAFSRVYELHVNTLYSYGTKFTSDTEMVKDCIHEVYLDLYTHRNTLSDISNIKFYLFKALKHTILRKIKQAQKITGRDAINRVSNLFQHAPNDFNIEYSVEDYIIQNEKEAKIKEYVMTLLKKLNNKQREILYLRFNQGFNYDQIGKIVGITNDSAKKQVYRILKKLRGIAGKDSLYVTLILLSM